MRRYCSKRSSCPNGDGTQQGRDACQCSYQCDGPCGGFCNNRGGRRSLLDLWTKQEAADWSTLTPEMIH